MFAIYLEKDAFDRITFYDEEKLTTTKKIMSRNIPILINLTDEELEKELEDDDSPLSLMMRESASFKKPIPLKSHFENILRDESILINEPRAVYILNVEKTKADELTRKYGVLVLSAESIDDNVLRRGYSRDLVKGESIDNGWRKFWEYDWKKGNTLIISDSYLFQNSEGDKNRGIENVKMLFDAYLPDTLETTFQITILADNNPRGKGIGKSPDWWQTNFGSLKAYLKTIRDYEIELELYLSDALHKRVLISNYIYSWTDKGFDIFKYRDQKTVLDDNIIHIHHLFNNIDDFGESYYEMSANSIKQIKEKCASASKFVSAQKKQSIDRMALGDCNKDKTSRNRLFI